MRSSAQQERKQKRAALLRQPLLSSTSQTDWNIMNHVAGIELPPMDIVRVERGRSLKNKQTKKIGKVNPSILAGCDGRTRCGGGVNLGCSGRPIPPPRLPPISSSPVHSGSRKVSGTAKVKTVFFLYRCAETIRPDFQLRDRRADGIV